MSEVDGASLHPNKLRIEHHVEVVGQRMDEEACASLGLVELLRWQILGDIQLAPKANMLHRLGQIDYWRENLEGPIFNHQLALDVHLWLPRLVLL